MKIRTVSFEKLTSFGNYENETIGVGATIDEDETPEEALKGAISFVEAQVEKRAEMRGEVSSLRLELWALNNKKSDLRREIQELREAFEENRDMMERFGIYWIPDIPF